MREPIAYVWAWRLRRVLVGLVAAGKVRLRGAQQRAQLFACGAVERGPLALQRGQPRVVFGEPAGLLAAIDARTVALLPAERVEV